MQDLYHQPSDCSFEGFSGLPFRVPLRVQGLGLVGLGFRVLGSGFRV